MSHIERLNDESLNRLYKSIREQVAEDMRLGGRHRFVGETARQHAE